VKKVAEARRIADTCIRGAVITDPLEFLQWLDDEILDKVRADACFSGEYFSDILNNEIFVFANDKLDPEVDIWMADLLEGIDDIQEYLPDDVKRLPGQGLVG
jgi:hypothetical protein